jgi:hypothetical protein
MKLFLKSYNHDDIVKRMMRECSFRAYSPKDAEENHPSAFFTLLILMLK